MNHLDKLYKDKLNDREFEFDESLWDQAESLIIADEEKKKKRAFVWWIFGGIVLISMIGGVFIWNNNQNTQVIPNENIVQNFEENKLKELNKNSINSELNSNEKVKEFTQKEFTQTIDNENVSKNNLKLNSDNSTLKRIIKPDIKNTEIKEDSSTKKAEVPIAQEASKRIKFDTPKVLDSKEKQLLADGRIPTQITENITQISLLKLNPFFIKNSSEIRSLTDYKPEKNRKLAIGLVGGLVYFPNSQLNSELSYKGGLSLGIPLKNRWEVGTELSYFVFNNEMKSIEESTHTTYGFGGDYDTYQLNANSLHFLNIPIYTKYKFGFHVLEGGVGLDYLLGARGELVLNDHLQSWERDDNQDSKYIQAVAFAAAANGQTEALNEVRYSEDGVVEKGWLDDSNLNKLQTHILFGYRYRANSKMDFGIRAQFRLTDFHKTNSDFMKNDSPFSFHLSANYRIW